MHVMHTFIMIHLTIDIYDDIHIKIQVKNKRYNVYSVKVLNTNDNKKRDNKSDKTW